MEVPDFQRRVVDQVRQQRVSPGVPVVRTGQRTVVVPRIQSVARVVDAPVIVTPDVERFADVPTQLIVQRTAESPQIQYLNKFVGVLVQRAAEVPPVQRVHRFPAVLVIATVGRVVDVPVTRTDRCQTRRWTFPSPPMLQPGRRSRRRLPPRLPPVLLCIL